MTQVALLLLVLTGCWGQSEEQLADDAATAARSVFYALEKADCDAIESLLGEEDCAEVLSEWDEQGIHLDGIAETSRDARAEDTWLVQCAISVRGRPRARPLVVTVRKLDTGWRVEM